MTIRVEDLKEKRTVVLKNSNNGEIDTVVHLNDTKIGTTSNAKNLEVTGDLRANGLLNSNGQSYVDPSPFGLRLTLTTAVPVTSADVTNASTLYLTPFTSGHVALYNGARWVDLNTPEVSLSLSGLTSANNYDVFLYLNGSAATLELSAVWTNDTTRADAISRLDGVFVKSANSTRRYVGTIRATGTTTTTDSTAQRFVWNNYNQANRTMRVIESTSSWAYTTAAFRQTRATTSNKVEYVTGDASSLVKITAMSVYFCATAAVVALGGVGIDSTTVNSAQIYGGNNAMVGIANKDIADYRGYPGLGYHAVSWLEYGGANVTFIGNFALPTTYQSGMSGEIMG